MSPDDARHGTTAGHAAGCRLECCASAKLRYDKRRKWETAQDVTRKVSALGSIRRVQALRALGWSVPAQAVECGLNYRQIYCLERHPTCYRRTHDAIAAMYERLAMRLPPTETQGQKHAATKCRRTAQRHGWPPPLAWDDIDDPDEVPSGVRYQVPTRAELLAELDARGDSLSRVCHELDLTRKTLNKWCERNGQTDLFTRLLAREQMHYWRNGVAEAKTA